MIHSNSARVFLVIFSLFISISLSAQKSASTSVQGSKAGYGVISGNVRDGVTKERVEYASVVLFRLADSSIVSGAITDSIGYFSIGNIAAGKYYLKIQFIGYENLLIPGLSISAKTADIKVGDISIQPNSSALTGVVITSQKAMVSNNLDKKIIAVDKSLALGGGTGTDVVENIPSVAVDADGNVSLRGNANITLLIDGKPSSQTGISASDLLNQIPASAIENVEVITNPSVRYDPDGTSGIINIVLKKKAIQGFNGMVSTNIGTGDKYSGSLNLNYRMNKLNFFTGFDWRKNHMKTSMESTRNSTYDGVENVLHQTESGSRDHNMYSINGGVDYFIDSRNNLTISAQSRNMAFNSGGNMLNSYFDDKDSLLRYFERKTTSDRAFNTMEYTLSYKHLFPQKGREFTNDFILGNYQMNNTSNSTQQDYTAPGGEIIGNPVLQKNDAENANKMFTLQGNYIYPMENGGRVETGYKAAIRDMSMLYNYYNFNQATGEMEEQTALKNQYDYVDQLYAVYGIYGNSVKKLKYQAGLRFEQAFTNSKVALPDTTINTQYSQFYPSLHFQYDIGKERELQLSYSRRVNRPSPRELNPYVDYSDSLNIETGNPALKPEFTTSLEFGMMKYWKKSSLTSNIFYRHTTDLVEDITKMLDNGVTITSPQNINSSDSYGLEMVGAANPAKWFRLNANVSLYRSLTGAIPEMNIQASDQFSWSSRVNMSFIPWKDASFQLIGTYNSPTRSAQEYHKSQYYADASFRQDFLKNKLSFSLRLTDIFNTRTFYETTYGDGFTTESKRYRESRILYAGLQLQINNYNKKDVKTINNGDNQEPDGF
jgi:outer membrane receptor protein involved in Fe transport